MNFILFSFYEKELYRKLKLNTYLNTKRSEQRMMNSFQKKFGNKEEVIVCFGDYEQKQHMKFKEPIKGKGMRTLFKRNGYRTYLVDEFRTSCRCSNCEGGECEKFLKRKISCSESEEIRTIHGLLRCKTCGSVWNRDCNGAKNIYKISRNSINRIERPSYLSRNRGMVHNMSKSKFTRLEAVKSSDILKERC
jgi:transposase